MFRRNFKSEDRNGFTKVQLWDTEDGENIVSILITKVDVFTSFYS